MPTKIDNSQINDDKNKELCFSVIVPAYNEEKGVIQTLEKLIGILDHSNYETELIVVNDGSTDKTQEILEQSDLEFRLITHNVNKGYGAALKTGINRSTYENIVIIDADGTYPEEDVQKLLSLMSEYDMVVGARVGKSDPEHRAAHADDRNLVGVHADPDDRRDCRQLVTDLAEGGLHALHDVVGLLDPEIRG